MAIFLQKHMSIFSEEVTCLAYTYGKPISYLLPKTIEILVYT